MRSHAALPRTTGAQPAPVGPASHAGHPAGWAGNQALQHHLRSGALRAKLAVGGVGDPAERDADRVAEEVMSGGKAGPCACGGSCPACKSGGLTLRRKPAEGAGGGAAHVRADAFGRRPGRALDAGARAFFEPHFGDLSDVRVHHDPEAAQTAEAIGARAYAVGRDIGFAQGEFEPGSTDGRRLLAHELAHLSQGGSVLRRQPKPDPAKSAAFRVETVSAADYEAMTGTKATDLPEKKYVASEHILLGPGLGALLSPRPGLPVPMGSTGIIWEGAHVTDFAAVPETNPFMRFVFGEGSLRTRGFRSDLWRHVLARMNDPFGVGRGLKDSLYSGVPGAYEGDWMFPYRPGAQAVHTPGGPNAIPDAEALAALMDKSVPGMEGKQYRFSFPRDPKTEARMLDALSKKGVTPCAPGTNCITLNLDIHETALGQRMVIERNGRLIDVATGMDVTTGEPAPSIDPRWENSPMRRGEASSMNEYLGQSDEAFGSKGLRKTPISSGMWMRGAVGVIRVGGTVLLIYNAYKTADRISQTSQADMPVVVGEEAGAWAGGAIGAILAEAFGAVVVCTGTGPGAALCLAGFAIVGGALGTGPGQEVGHELGQAFKTAKDLTGKDVMEAGLMLGGSKQDIQTYQGMRQAEGAPKGGSIFDFFNF